MEMNMKYIFAIITGLLLGNLNHESADYLIGGIIGFLVIQLLDLKSKVNKLEKRLSNKQSKKVSSDLIPDNTEIKTPERSHEEIISHSKPTGKLDTLQEAVIDETQQVVSQAIEEHIPKDSSLEIDRNIIKQMSPEYYDDDDTKTLQTEIITEPIKQHVSVVETKPSIIEIGLSKIKSMVISYFTGGNSMVRTGMLVLFIGVAFLLKYVAERTVIPVEYRYIGVSFASLTMLIIGWKLRKKRHGFALSLEGGGIGLLYLTLFSAMRIHQLLPAKMVLLLLVGIVILSALLAILENSMALAIIGMIGGFAAPILTSTGSGSHVQLFSYYLLLNVGVFAIAWFKSWRILNVLGFVATFGIGSLWGYKYYQPEFLMSVEPFLIAYFLLYTFIAVLFALKQPPKLKGINDGTIIFGTPLVGFALQAALMKDSEYGLAYSALALGVFYVLFAYIIKLMKKPYMKDLIESFVALGIGFATLAIPLGFDGRVTSAMWVAEGSALLWVGIRQSRIFPRLSGYALTVFGAAAFFVENNTSSTMMPWLNADYIGILIIVCATAFISLYARMNTSKLFNIEARLIPTIMIILSVTWWIFGGIFEIKLHYNQIEFILLELFLAVSIFALILFGNKTQFNLLKQLSIIVAFIMFTVIDGSFLTAQDQYPMFWNVRFVGLIIIALTHLYLSWYWSSQSKYKSLTTLNYFSSIFLATGLINWLLTMSVEIMFYYPIEQFVLIEAMMSISALIILALGIRLKLISYKLSSAIITLLMLVPVGLIPKSNNELPALLNIPFLGLLIYSLTHYFMSWYWQRTTHVSVKSLATTISNSMLAIAIIAWVVLGHKELHSYMLQMDYFNSSMIFMAISFVIWILLAHKLNWQSLHLVKYAYTPYLILMCFTIISNQYNFHQSYGLFVWLLSAIINYWVLRIYDNNKIQNVNLYHLFGLILFSFITIFELTELSKYLLGKNSIWHYSSPPLILLIITTVIFALRSSKLWPLNNHKKVYFHQGLSVLIAATWLFVIAINLSTPGNLSFIPYLPILNAMDVVSIGFVLLAWKVLNSKIISLNNDTTKFIIIGIAATAFLTLNASMLRSFHFWYGIEYKWNIMLKSFMIQSGFSILWSLTAVILMVLAAKKHMRTMWLVGLGLMIAVVVKLFIIDMSASGTVERIIAFLSVGILLSLVGYFSPLPPNIEKTSNEKIEGLT